MPTTSITAHQWLQKLKSRGIKEFEFSTLPEDLKIVSAHKKAIMSELIEKVSISKKGVATWRIKHYSKIT